MLFTRRRFALAKYLETVSLLFKIDPQAGWTFLKRSKCSARELDSGCIPRASSKFLLRHASTRACTNSSQVTGSREAQETSQRDG
jgi:hypothetical protein